MDLQTNSDASKVDLNDLLEVIVSDDNMTGYILLKKAERRRRGWGTASRSSDRHRRADVAGS